MSCDICDGARILSGQAHLVGRPCDICNDTRIDYIGAPCRHCTLTPPTRGTR